MPKLLLHLFDNNNNSNKTNNKSNKNKPDRAHIKAKRKEMLDFRKRLPIYSGKYIYNKNMKN